MHLSLYVVWSLKDRPKDFPPGVMTSHSGVYCRHVGIPLAALAVGLIREMVEWYGYYTSPSDLQREIDRIVANLEGHSVVVLDSPQYGRRVTLLPVSRQQEYEHEESG